jgi:beta-galactosidase
MNTLPCFLILLIIGCLLFGCGPMEKSEVVFIKDDSREIPFDTHWFFYRDSLAGAEQVDFDDSQWQEIDLPHDWSIKDLPEKPGKRQIGPFSEESPGGSSTGHVLGGIGWYRKHFRLKGDTDKIITIHFDGIYMNSDVWINGDHLGKHPYGYTPFVYDLTPHLNPPGADNVIAVEVKNEGENSRWYSGSGIYRHIRLTVTDPVHVDNWGVAITTPKVSEKQAEVRIKTTMRNRTDTEKPITVKIRITNDENRICGKAQTTSQIEPNSSSDIVQFIEVEAPKLWSPDSPRLYLAMIELQIDGKTVDLVSAPFGIRSIRYDVDEGFILNGKPVLFRGGCIHHDNGPLGSAAIDRAEERRIELLK